MTFRPSCLFLCLSAALLCGSAFAVPVIDHQPVKTAALGQPISILARIKTPANDPVTTVNLYFSQSRDAAPSRVEMKSTAPGLYYASIPANFTRNKGSIQYYMDAATQSGEWTESTWNTVSVRDSAARGSAPGQPVAPPAEPGVSKRSWLWPTVIIGGGALAVAGGVALASDSGGDDSSSDSSGGSATTDGGTTPTEIVRNTSDTYRAAGLILPRDRTVSPGAELAGRTITGINVVLNYSPGGFEDQFQIVYKGVPVSDSGAAFVDGQLSIQLDGTSPDVTIRVADATANANGVFAFSWDAIVTYTVE